MMPACADIIASSPAPTRTHLEPCAKTADTYRAIEADYPYHFVCGFEDGDCDRRRALQGRRPRPTAGKLVIMVTPNFASPIEDEPSQWAYAMAYMVGRHGTPAERLAVDGLINERP